MPCKGSALLELALGSSKFNSCPPPRLPANCAKSSSGSLPGLKVPNLDLRFSTLCVFSSLTFRRGSGAGAAALFLFEREKGRNFDRFRCKESCPCSSISSVGAVMMMAGAINCHYQQASPEKNQPGQTYLQARQGPQAQAVWPEKPVPAPWLTIAVQRHFGISAN